jgi:hypothetical protein
MERRTSTAVTILLILGGCIVIFVAVWYFLQPGIQEPQETSGSDTVKESTSFIFTYEIKASDLGADVTGTIVGRYQLSPDILSYSWGDSTTTEFYQGSGFSCVTKSYFTNAYCGLGYILHDEKADFSERGLVYSIFSKLFRGGNDVVSYINYEIAKELTDDIVGYRGVTEGPTTVRIIEGVSVHGVFSNIIEAPAIQPPTKPIASIGRLSRYIYEMKAGIDAAITQADAGKEEYNFLKSLGSFGIKPEEYMVPSYSRLGDPL